VGKLDGRVVIVTGAGRGLGRAHALELAKQGAIVVVNDLGVGVKGEKSDEPSPAESVVAEIEAMGGVAVTDSSSVSDFAAMEALVASTVERFGDLHAVVNNAGFLRDRVITSMTEDDFDAVINVHLKGTFCLTRHACVYWKDQHKAGKPVSGRVVTTTSGAGLLGNMGQTNYASAKAGIAMLTQVVSMEMQRYGVSVNCVSPVAATRMLATVGREASADGGWDALDPANASPVVAWLCSEESGWLSGNVLRIDGNTVKRMIGWKIGDGFTSASKEALTVDELGLGLRKLYGVAHTGLMG
jgi:NAD(P)-dependent dehydrogenase (short-subunit alcohol dehydrogenase family)